MCTSYLYVRYLGGRTWAMGYGLGNAQIVSWEKCASGSGRENCLVCFNAATYDVIYDNTTICNTCYSFLLTISVMFSSTINTNLYESVLLLSKTFIYLLYALTTCLDVFIADYSDFGLFILCKKYDYKHKKLVMCQILIKLCILNFHKNILLNLIFTFSCFMNKLLGWYKIYSKKIFTPRKNIN